jgi:cysteinyl-tRNA synthetase, unknown class
VIRRRALVLALVAAASFSGVLCGMSSPREAMRDFVIALAGRAHAADPDFLVIPQNGLELLTTDGRPDGDLESPYVASLDGVGQEDLNYGYTGDEMPTPPDDRARLLTFLDRVKESGRAVLVVDYCAAPSHIEAARAVCAAHGFAGYAAPSRGLEIIASDPLQPFDARATGVASLALARNVLYLLNPERYSSRQALVSALAATAYDVVVMDAWFDIDEALTRTDVLALERKPGGGRRLVFAYLSIGEAEDYRSDWNPAWATDPPPWLGEENPDWPGNYAVEYWDAEWQSIVAGRLDALVGAGFDGVYLDKVDAFETFESEP